MGAAASKKLSPPPHSRAISSASGPAVSGPVATTTIPSAGIASTRSRRTVMSGCAQYSRRHRAGKRVPIHGERAARRHLAGESRRHAYAAKPPHLFLKQPRRAVQPLGLQRVGTHQLRESLPVMGRGVLSRLHLGQFHRTPACAMAQAASQPASPAPMTRIASIGLFLRRARPSPAPPGLALVMGPFFKAAALGQAGNTGRCAPFS